MRRWGGPARAALASVLLAALLLLFVFPTRSWLAQRDDIGRARHDLEVLQTENERLSRESARLSTPSEIERIAREQFHMVRPGERAFAVVPAPLPVADGQSADSPEPSDGNADGGQATVPPAG